jgi:hypothetical protein
VLAVRAEDQDKLEEQFLEYQVADLGEVPERIDEAWAQLSAKTDFSGRKEYDILARVMLGILTIFHANADCERIFSVVRKNKTESRPSLQLATLNALLTRKVYMGAYGLSAQSQTFPKSVLRMAKSATVNKLKANK